jgi:phosphatidylglycerol:prolipoprotein diacylglycerol transferase
MLPVLAHIGPITIYSYTVLLDLAILIGLFLVTWHGWRNGDEPALWFDLSLIGMAAGILGGRLGHVAVHWLYFVEHPVEIPQFWLGGIEWHIAVVAGLIALLVECGRRRVSFGQMADTLARVFPVAVILIYTGCLMGRCSYGREVTSLADYPPYLVAELPDMFGVIAPRLMTQVYGIMLGVLLLMAAFILVRTVRRTGVSFWILLAALGFGTFTLGFTLGDSILMLGPLRLDQILDLAIIVIGIGGAYLALRGSSLSPPVRTSTQ